MTKTTDKLRCQWIDGDGNDHLVLTGEPCKSCGCRVIHAIGIDGCGWVHECVECKKTEKVTQD